MAPQAGYQLPRRLAARAAPHGHYGLPQAGAGQWPAPELASQQEKRALGPLPDHGFALTEPFGAAHVSCNSSGYPGQRPRGASQHAAQDLKSSSVLAHLAHRASEQDLPGPNIIQHPIGASTGDYGVTLDAATGQGRNAVGPTPSSGPRQHATQGLKSSSVLAHLAHLASERELPGPAQAMVYHELTRLAQAAAGAQLAYQARPVNASIDPVLFRGQGQVERVKAAAMQEQWGGGVAPPPLEGLPLQTQHSGVSSVMSAASGDVSNEDGEGGDNPKKLRRLICNRASAKRSRQRKQDRLQELEVLSAKLRVETTSTQRKLTEAQEHLRRSEETNAQLRKQISMLQCKLKCKREQSSLGCSGDGEVNEPSSSGGKQDGCGELNEPSTSAGKQDGSGAAVSEVDWKETTGGMKVPAGTEGDDDIFLCLFMDGITTL